MLTGKELKIKRILVDIEAQEVAKYLGVSKTYISLMEKGSRRISVDTYVKWIRYLNDKLEG
jgi:transcriptional regulator with XRE-family HTH domain